MLSNYIKSSLKANLVLGNMKILQALKARTNKIHTCIQISNNKQILVIPTKQKVFDIGAIRHHKYEYIPRTQYDIPVPHHMYKPKIFIAQHWELNDNL